MQKDTEVSHRKVKEGTKNNCDLKENQSGFSETRRWMEMVKKHSEFATRGEPLNTLFNMDYTSKDGSSQTKLTCQEHVSERIVEQIVDVRVPLSILEETIAVMKLAPHEHTQTTVEDSPSRSSSTRWTIA